MKKLGPWSKGEKIVLAVFILTALVWINSSPKTIGDIHTWNKDVSTLFG